MPSVEHELVDRGVEFQQSFVTTSLCCPSRASLYSGQYAHHHGVRSNFPPLGGAGVFDPTSTLPVWLSAVGYRTALFGKYMNANYVLAPKVPPGWDVWQTFVEDGGDHSRVYFDYTLNENGHLVSYGTKPSDYSTDVLARRTLDFIQSNADRPFFVVYAPFAPHIPSVPAPRHVGHFKDLPPHRPPNWAEADVSKKPDWVKSMKAITHPEGLAATDQLRIHMLESLLAVDEAVKAFVEKLESLGLGDDTVVIFTSDNGFHWREHWWIFKQVAYEEAIRVPLVLRYPELFPVASARDEMVLNIDLAPTLAELGGARVPGNVDGVSLLGLLEGRMRKWRQDFLEENFTGLISRPSTAIRTKRWKFIKTHEDHGVTEELYDLASDPYELHNLALDTSHAATVALLKARMAELGPSADLGRETRERYRQGMEHPPTGRYRPAGPDD